jgi:hypothetical protein
MNQEFVAVEITPADIRELLIDPEVEDSSKCSTKTALGGLCILGIFGILAVIIVALIKTMNVL